MYPVSEGKGAAALSLFWNLPLSLKCIHEFGVCIFCGHKFLTGLRQLGAFTPFVHLMIFCLTPSPHYIWLHTFCLFDNKH